MVDCIKMKISVKDNFQFIGEFQFRIHVPGNIVKEGM